jgi:enhancer of polycomb-like protein
LRPSQRAAQIQAAVEKDLARLKEKDKDWEDALDNPYQNRPVPYAERFFKYIAAPTALSKALVGPDGRKQPDQVAQQPHALRLRLGRGGRLHLDRRRPPPQAIHSEETHPFLRLADSEEDTAGSETGGDENADEAEEVDEYREMLRLEVEETRRRMQERWRFDDDDGPAVGPLGSEEQDRVLYDDYQGKHIVHMACLFKPVDWEALKTDISIAGFNSEGRPTRITPEAIKISQQPLNRPPARHMPPPSSSAYANAFAAASAGTSVSTNGQQPGVNGTPISTMKRMPPPSLSQMRISFNGGIARPGMQPPAQPGLGSPVRPMSANGIPNGGPNGSPIKSPAGGQMVIDGDTPSQDDSSSMVIDGVMAAPLQQRPKSLMMPNSFPSSGSMPNGFPTNMSGITNSNAAAYISHTGPNGAVGAPHQMQDLKSAFANVSDMAAMTAMSGIGGGGMGVGVPNGGMSTMPGPQPIGGRPGFPAHVVSNNTTFHLPLGNNNGFNLKLPPTRQTQWSQAGQPGHGPGPMSGFMPGSVPIPNMQTMQTMQNGSPSHAHAQAAMLAMNGLPSPARTPSANRMRANIGPDAAQMLSVTQGGVGMGVNINGAPLSQSPLLHAQAMQTVQRSPHMHAHAISPMPMSGIVSLSPHHSPMRLASSPVPPSPLMQAAAPAAAPLPNTASGY